MASRDLEVANHVGKAGLLAGFLLELPLMGCIPT